MEKAGVDALDPLVIAGIGDVAANMQKVIWLTLYPSLWFSLPFGRLCD